MKKFLLIITLFLVFSGILYSKISSYQVVDVYICEEGPVLAEMLAKSKVSRKELYYVSYCKCEGIDPSVATDMNKESCKPPKNMVYACICVGRSHY